MIRLRVFVSSVQKEMENERQAIRAYLRDDPLLRRFFDVFLFEDLPAVIHRDYTSNGSVQVMLFSDRLEVRNPGTLPPALTLEKLRHPHGSVPGNPLLAESLYLTKYIERMGTGIGDMIQRCKNFGLLEPEFAMTDGFVTTIRRRHELSLQAVSGTGAPQVGPQVTPPVEVLLRLLDSCGALSNAEIRKRLGLKNRKHMQERYLNQALRQDLLSLPSRKNQGADGRNTTSPQRESLYSKLKEQEVRMDHIFHDMINIWIDKYHSSICERQTWKEL